MAQNDDPNMPCSGNSKKLWDVSWKGKHTDHKISILRKILRKIYKAIVPYPSPSHYFLSAWLSQWVDMAKMRVLEIGGAGGLGYVISSKAKSYTLLDYSETAIQKAEQVLADVPNASCVLGDMFDFMPDHPQELVISMGLIEHFFGQEKKKCIQAHNRISQRYVCVGAPSCIPLNWWRHFRFERTKQYPSQRPVSEKELFDLCLDCGLRPIAMTRIDPWYARIPKGRIIRAMYLCFAAWYPNKKWAIDRQDGGLVVVLAEKKTD